MGLNDDDISSTTGPEGPADGGADPDEHGPADGGAEAVPSEHDGGADGGAGSGL